MEPEAPWPVLSQEAISKLASGVHYCFLQWTALQLAISNEWGGRNSNQKALQLEKDVVVWFAHSRVRRYIDELEELLDDVMNEQFSTQAEDDSIQEVATQLFILHEECSQGNYETVNRLAAGASQSKAASAKSVKAPNENGEESESDEDSMDEEGPSSSGQQQDASMEVDAPVTEGSRASRQQERPSTLTQEEMADGWQEAPTRRKGRGGNRT
jgi:pre-rRNA-processing protein TSR2